jgi:hypothetical protein
VAGERDDPLLAALALDAYVRAGAQHDVADSKTRDLRDAQAGLEGKGEQGVIASPYPGRPVGRCEQGVDLGSDEERHDPAGGALLGDGKDLGDERGVARFPIGGEAVKGADSGQPGVAAAHAVVPLVFKVLQEGSDQLGVQVDEVELTGLFASAGVGEAEQEPEGVAVRGDGVVAGPPLADEALGEERLQDRRQRAHDRAPF